MFAFSFCFVLNVAGVTLISPSLLRIVLRSRSALLYAEWQLQNAHTGP